MFSISIQRSNRGRYLLELNFGIGGEYSRLLKGCLSVILISISFTGFSILS